jgi:serine/threonine protein kinase
MAFFKKLFEKKEGKPEGAQQAQQAPPPPPQETVTREDFEEIEVLGKGSFARVVLVKKRNSNNEFFAMKVIDKKTILEHKRTRDAFIERDVMRRLPHPYLLHLHYTFQTEHKLFFVVDYMPGGDLDKYLNSQPNKAVDLPTTQLYGAQVFLALKHLHRNGVIYRDLKPENILLNHAGHCVIADFGLSKDFGSSVDQMMAQSFVGSPFYVAPDVLRQKEYTNAIDFWSFGILLYRMLYGRPPVSGRTMKEVFDNIMTKDFTYPTPGVPGDEGARDLISKLLVKDPARRAGVAEVEASPFWTGLNLADVEAVRVLPPRWVPLPPTEVLVQQRAAARPAGAAPAPAASSTRPVDVTHTAAGTAPLSAAQQAQFEAFEKQ